VAVDSQQFAMLLRLSCVKQAIHVLDAWQWRHCRTPHTTHWMTWHHTA
jgi:hypothetical protein